MRTKHPRMSRRRFLGSTLSGTLCVSLGATSAFGVGAVEQTTGDASIRPFRFHASDAALANMRWRIAATKWPSRELVTDATQGVQLATMRERASHWQTDYDWRKCDVISVAVSAFPDEIYTAPRSWTEKACPKLIHYARLPEGGHFAAWEQGRTAEAAVEKAARYIQGGGE